MEQKTITCIVCKGSGTQNVSYEEYGKPETKRMSKHPCIGCGGKGKVTPKRNELLEFERDMWCKCEKPGPPTYHPNNEKGATISKHHYTCNVCNKITQIG